MRTEEEIREFCIGHYYCDPEILDNGITIREVWEPFENYSPDWIENQINGDIRSFIRFTGWKEEAPEYDS